MCWNFPFWVNFSIKQRSLLLAAAPKSCCDWAVVWRTVLNNNQSRVPWRMNQGRLINESTSTKAQSDLNGHKRTCNLGQSSLATRGSELKDFTTNGSRTLLFMASGQRWPLNPNAYRKRAIGWSVMRFIGGPLEQLDMRFKTSVLAQLNACGAHAWGGIPMRQTEVSQTQQRIIIAELTP